MKIFDFITGGNPKVISRKMAKYYNAMRDNRKYDATFETFSMGIKLRLNSSNRNDIDLDEIKNLGQLAALHLNIYCAPPNTSYLETWNAFGDKVSNYLIKFGVNHNHVWGENLDNPRTLEQYKNEILQGIKNQK
jgi:hypothetical protein